MIVDDHIVSKIGEHVREAERRVLKRYILGRIREEPSITDAFFHDLERVVEEHGREGRLQLNVWTLTSHGPNTAERRYGADVLVVLNVDLEEFRESKGFLAQAKMAGNGISVERTGAAVRVGFGHNDKIQVLKDQIMRMKRVSLNENYVIVYSPEGLFVVPGHAIVDLARGTKVYGATIASFFKQFVMCFIGDHALRAFDEEEFERLVANSDARTGVLITVKSNREQR
jgi:hypothetical protein